MPSFTYTCDDEEIEIVYTIQPYERQTLEHEGCPEHVHEIAARLNGVDIPVTREMESAALEDWRESEFAHY